MDFFLGGGGGGVAKSVAMLIFVIVHACMRSRVV